MAEILAGSVAEFDDENRKILATSSGDVVVLRHAGAFHAFENRCLHMGGPVGEGMIIGKTEAVLDADRRVLEERFSETEIHLVCPWHGWEYDIRTGEFAGDRSLCLKRFETAVRGDQVYVVV